MVGVVHRLYQEQYQPKHKSILQVMWSTMSFLMPKKKIIIADIGHFESEQFTIDIFYELLTKKLTNFAILKKNVKTNPINYL